MTPQREERSQSPEIPAEILNPEAFLPELHSSFEEDINEYICLNELMEEASRDASIPDELLHSPEVRSPSPTITEYFEEYDRDRWEEEMNKREWEAEARRYHRYHNEQDGYPSGVEDYVEYLRARYEVEVQRVSNWNTRL
jgi:hypothetical protein